jgi:Glycosyltransferase Family 4
LPGHRGRGMKRLAILGNHLPRQCGIATFTTHLAEALAAALPDADAFVIAMNDGGRRHAYPPQVRFEIADGDLASYRRAADFLNVNDVDVLSLQHEYGIFGGKAGAHVLTLLGALRMPIVTTLHTVLSSPRPSQRAVIDQLATLSDRLVVMSVDAADLLRQVYGIAVDQIDLIPDAVPHDERRQTMCARDAAYGAGMSWPEVARQHVESFARAHAEHARRRRTAFRAQTLAGRPAGLPDLTLKHVWAMSDDTGILQHAIFATPRYDDGYCLDDNARALLLTVLLEDGGFEEPALVRKLGARYLAFVSYAFDRAAGRFRNVLTYARHWLEPLGSEDSHGRALWALGALIGRSGDANRQRLAGELFHNACPAVTSFTSPRAWAFALLGIDEYLKAFQGDSAAAALRAEVAELLYGLFQRTNRPDWPWFEESVTYGSGRLAQALIVCGERMHRRDMLDAGTRALEWLVAAQSSPDKQFAPIGSGGFCVRGALPAAFDQQPVEAAAMVSACLEAYRAGGEQLWLDRARWAFRWFVGENHLQECLFDPSTGGCRDGLHADRADQHQGAEATLSFLLALHELRSVAVLDGHDVPARALHLV